MNFPTNVKESSQTPSLLVGASMERVGFQAGTTESVVNNLLEATYRITPGLKDAAIIEQWMGFRPGSPDGMPYLGPVEGHPGLWTATGHYRNGVALAPGTADMMSRWIMGETPSMDLFDFRVNRPVVNLEKVGFFPPPHNAVYVFSSWLGRKSIHFLVS